MIHKKIQVRKYYIYNFLNNLSIQLGMASKIYDLGRNKCLLHIYLDHHVQFVNLF